MSFPTAFPTCRFPHSAGFKKPVRSEGKSVLLTFGLLGPGKGIEHAIRGDAGNHPPPSGRRLSGSRSHPPAPARALEGEKYRTSLEHLAEDLGVATMSSSSTALFRTRTSRTSSVRRTSISRPISTKRRSPPARWPMSSVRARWWFPRPTGTRGNCSPTIAACWCPSAIPRRSPTRSADCWMIPRAWSDIRRQAYEASRATIWPAVAHRYLESFDHASDRQPRRCRMSCSRSGITPPVPASCRPCASTTWRA